MRQTCSLLLTVAVALGAACAAPPGPRVAVAGQLELNPRARALSHFLSARLLGFREQNQAALAHLRAAVLAAPEDAFLRMRLATAYERAKERDRAVATCREATSLAPRDPAPWLLLGRLLFSANDREGAQAAWTRAIALDPQDEAPYLALAALHRDSGRKAEAIRTYEALVAARPQSATGLYRLARHHRENNRPDEAAKLYARAIAAGRAMRPLLELAYLHEERGERAQALARYREAHDLAPQSVDILQKLVELHLAAEDDTLALHYAAKLREEDSADGKARMRLGLAFLSANRVAMAVEELRVALAKAPTDHRVRYYLGVARAQLKQHREAAADLTAIPETDKLYLDARAQLAVVHRDAGHLEEAEREASRLVTRAPKHSAAYDILSSVQERRGQLPTAIETLMRGARALPEDERLAASLAVLLDRAGRFDEAVERMRAVLKRNPKSASALNFIGYSYADRGVRLDEAERLIRQALALRPNDGYIIDSLGWVLFKRGDVAGALSTLERARTIAPKEPAVYDHLGEVHQRRGDRTLAMEMFRKALTLDPDPRLRAQLEAKLRALVGRDAAASAAPLPPEPR